MSALVETAIWMAQKARISTIPLAYAKAWPSEKFEPPSDNGRLQPYLRIGRVAAPPSRVVVAYGYRNERVGKIIITLVYPLGQTEQVYTQIAAKIAEHFRDGTQMTFDGVCLTVPDCPHIQPGYEDTGYWNVPVVIPWRCFA